jgi:DNA gyrase subunit B
MRPHFPFSALVGQELLKKGLLVNAVDPSIGGVLLRVELGDETDADEIFSRLMGDQVEPRREFIEQNALNVSSLDI